MAKVTKVQILREFKDVVKGYAPEMRKDAPMMREAWNNYTDSLCKDGIITESQYNNWTSPF